MKPDNHAPHIHHCCRNWVYLSIYLSIYLSTQLGISAIMNDKIPIHWNGEGDVDLKLLCNTIAKTPIIMSDE